MKACAQTYYSKKKSTDCSSSNILCSPELTVPGLINRYDLGSSLLPGVVEIIPWMYSDSWLGVTVHES